MNFNENTDWFQFLSDEFKKPYFNELSTFVQSEYKNHRCFPEYKNVFRAFDLTLLKNVKVVILGQDPYHGPNQANGLCFSVNKGVAIPPSLKNIYKELRSNKAIEKAPSHGDLSPWSSQGVFLLNSCLSVREGLAGSHKNKGWERFTDAVIQVISKEKSGVIFLLWGGFSRKKKKLIDSNKHFILESGHPSPLSANRGLWFGNKHFSTTNSLLRQAGLQQIDWKID